MVDVFPWFLEETQSRTHADRGHVLASAGGKTCGIRINSYIQSYAWGRSFPEGCNVLIMTHMEHTFARKIRVSSPIYTEKFQAGLFWILHSIYILKIDPLIPLSRVSNGYIKIKGKSPLTSSARYLYSKSVCSGLLVICKFTTPERDDPSTY